MSLSTPVQSSNLDSVQFDAAQHTLKVEFKDGRRYCYLGVTDELYEEFLNASSKGRFLRYRIAPGCPCHKES